MDEEHAATAQPIDETSEPVDDGTDESGRSSGGDDARAAGPAERAFQLVEIRLDDGGVVGVRARERLTRSVYGRSVAAKYAAYEARKLARDVVLAVLDDRGRLLMVLGGGSGRAASTSVRRQVRRALIERQMAAASRKRTSRPPRVPGRRTSRPRKRRTWS